MELFRGRHYAFGDGGGAKSNSRRAYYLDRESGSNIVSSQPFIMRQMLLEPTRRLKVQKIIKSAGTIPAASFKQLKKALANMAVMSKFSVMNNTETNDFDSSEEKLEEAASEGPTSIVIKTPSRVISLQVPSLTVFMKDILLIPKRAIESANEVLNENSTETELGGNDYIKAPHHNVLDNIDLTTQTPPSHDQLVDNDMDALDHSAAPKTRDFVKLIIMDSEESDNDSHSDTDELKSNKTLPAVNMDS